MILVNTVVPKFNTNYVRGETPVYVNELTEVEVLTLNLNACSMRVRYTDVDVTGIVGKPGKEYTKTADVIITAFNEAYEIVPKTS